MTDLTTILTEAGLPGPNELRAFAEQLARGAGLIAAAAHSEPEPDARGESLSKPTTHTKSSPTDLVTAYDQAAERYIVERLAAERPDDGIVGEEGASVAGTSGLEWHIDPIDGTTNFVYQQPAWACSVGVAFDGHTVAGAVFVPVLDEMFSAADGHGATLNGNPIRVNDIDDLALALVATGFSYGATERGSQAIALQHILPAVRDIRRLGSAAIDLCFVACGRVDAYFEAPLNSWDMLAGELIAREAGAATSDFSGGTVLPAQVVASAPGIHEALLGLL